MKNDNDIENFNNIPEESSEGEEQNVLPLKNIPTEKKSEQPQIDTTKIKQHLQSNTAKYIVLGIILFFLLLCVITRPDNTGNFFYYALFLIIWPLLAYLAILGINFLKALYITVMLGSGVIAVVAALIVEVGIALIAGAIALCMLAILVAVAIGIAILIFGPGALAGIGINQLLGDTTFSGIIGFIVFLIISFIIGGFVMKIAFPFGFGFLLECFPAR